MFESLEQRRNEQSEGFTLEPRMSMQQTMNDDANEFESVFARQNTTGRPVVRREAMPRKTALKQPVVRGMTQLHTDLKLAKSMSHNNTS